MRQTKIIMNKDVTTLLDSLNHPFRDEIEQLRRLILNVREDVVENIKWSGPNYTIEGQDRVSIKVQPKNDFLLILHRGNQVLPEPEEKILDGHYSYLIWKSKDRAVASFKNISTFHNAKTELSKIINEWLAKTL